MTVPSWVPLVGVALVVTAVGVIGTIHVEPDAGQRPTDALAVVIVVVAGTSLLLRRRWPLIVLAVVTAAIGLYILREYPGGPVFLTGPVALYSFAMASERRVAYAAAGVMTALLIGLRVAVERDVGVEDLVLLGWGAAAVLAADAMRGRRERAAADVERRRNALEHREEETRRRIAEDRLQIARDLHDSVAHSMATINVQSGVAAHVVERQPEQAAAALEAIRVASRDVLDELSAMLAILRDGETPARQPTPDLTALRGLVESSRLAGLAVELRVDGDIGAITPAVSTAGYRIVQEALTNVARHASTDAAVVTVVRAFDGQVDLEVVDDGGGTAPATTTTEGTGMGLVGIRERAESTGGRWVIGPVAGGGFRVAVSWPGRT